MRIQPTVSIPFVKMLLSYCAELGMDAAQLTQSVDLHDGVLDDPEERISYRLFSALFSEAEKQSGLPDFGLQLGKRAVEYSGGHILISMMRSCATVQDALTRILRYHSLASDAFSFVVERQGNHTVIALRKDDLIPELPAPQTEQIFSMLVLITASLTSQPICPERIHFRHRSPGDISSYRDIFNGRISFKQQHDQLWYDTESLQQLLPMADPVFQQTIEQLVSRRMKDRMDANTWTARAERQLYRSLLNGEPPGFETLARQLGLSEKTLRRSLKNEGTNFKNVLDGVRMEMAQGLLSQPDVSFFDVALLLGYSEQSTFNHAFRRWTGMSPSDFIKQTGGI
jgi:AraC-like DNA-binding protein